jgi:hypothetical protein
LKYYKKMDEALDKIPVDESFHWDRLSGLHPTEVCNRTGALYNPTREGFVLPVYNLRYLIVPKDRKILRLKRNDESVEEALHPFFSLMVLVYLTDAKAVEPVRSWVSAKDLKGGSMFFRGPHSIDVGDVKAAFGMDPDAFLGAGKRLGGSEILYGDRAFALEVFPKVPIAYVLWKGDKEFPPDIGVLFDPTIESHFSLDLIWCMVVETSRRLVECQ